MTRQRSLLAAALVAVASCEGSCGHGAAAPPAQPPTGDGVTSPLTGAWRVLSGENAPAGAGAAAAAFGAGTLLVWGGTGPCLPLGLCGEGAVYDPSRDVWAPLASAGAPSGRDQHAVVWTEGRAFVWGGRGCGGLTTACGDGAIWDPASRAWTAVAATGAPSARGWHTAVWTGREALVWGGEDPASGAVLGDGGAYDVAAGRWRALAAAGAPRARRYHLAAWTGSEMLVWGGDGDARAGLALGDGAAYAAATDRWRALATQDAPAGRWAPAGVWTGSELIVWGGLGCGRDSMGDVAVCGDGARYDPAADRWRPLATAGAPSPRVGASAVWTGHEVIVWGGTGPRCGPSGGACADGGAYDPASDTWRSLAADPLAKARSGHVAAWTGTEMLVWGGAGGGASEAPATSGLAFKPSR